MSPHHSDQMSEMYNAHKIVFCMSISKVLSVSEWVSEWQGHLLSCSGQLKMGTQKLKKVPMGTRSPKWGPMSMWLQWECRQMNDRSFMSEFQCRAGAWGVSPEPSLVWCYVPEKINKNAKWFVLQKSSTFAETPEGPVADITCEQPT